MSMAMSAVRLETTRLVLRPYRETDFEELLAMSADPAMWRYSERGPMGSEEAWARLLRNCGHWALSGYGIFAIEEKETGNFVGEAGCSRFRRQLGSDFDPEPEISWAIGAAFQGRGYAAEAAQAALDWIEAARGAEWSVCLIHSDNRSSLRVAEKMGYLPMRRLIYRGYPALLMRRGRR